MKTPNLKHALFTFLLTSISSTGCAPSSSDNELSRAGEISGGGRRGARAVLVYFENAGTGIDSSANEAVELLFSEEKKAGRLVEQRRTSIESGTIICGEFSEYSDAYGIKSALGRVVWTSRANGFATRMTAKPDCGDAFMKPFQASSLGGYSKGEERQTMECSNQARPGSYSAKLKVYENVSWENDISVRMELYQESPNARFALIKDTTDAWDIDPNSGIVKIRYSGNQLALVFGPSTKGDKRDAVLQLNSSGATIEMACTNVQ